MSISLPICLDSLTVPYGTNHASSLATGASDPAGDWGEGRSGPPQWSLSAVRSGTARSLEPALLWHDVYHYLAVVAESSAEFTVTVTLRRG